MIDVDTHDPAGMARWLRERSEAAKMFLALTDDQQRNQFLTRWQQNILPHLAFRFEQAARMVERLAERERVLLDAHTGCGCGPSCAICDEKGYT